MHTTLDQAPHLEAAKRGDTAAFDKLVASHRRQLQAHCYRMMGSVHDAEDLAQEALLRAWRGIGAFEGRSSFRTWLYRVTTNTCLDALRQRAPRILPTSAGHAIQHAGQMEGPTSPTLWLEPFPDAALPTEDAGPEATLTTKQSVSLAFLHVLQQLPPKQRAVLLLREVLGFSAGETAEVLELTVAAVNSALQRARETLDGSPPPLDQDVTPNQEALLGRYLGAWQTGDIPGLVAVLKQDARLSMPPLAAWFQGRDVIGRALGDMVLTPGSSGVFTLVPTRANGLPAFGVYRLHRESNQRVGEALHVLLLEDGAVEEIVAFLDPRLFARFGLPAALPV